MGEHDLSVYIARGVETGHAGLHIFVGDDGAAFHNGIQRLKSVTLRNGAAADGAEDFVGGSYLNFSVGRLELYAFGQDRGNFAAEVEFDALCLVVAKQYL